MPLVEQAVLNPGNCMICSSSQGPFIDTLRDDDDGQVVPDGGVAYGITTHYYLCSRCVISMASEMAARTGHRLVLAATLEEQAASYAEMAAHVVELSERIVELEGALRVVQSVSA